MSRHAAVLCRIAGMTDKLFRRTTTPPRWIAAVSAAEEYLSRKERKEHKEMKGGNGVSAASGITQFAEGEPKRRNYETIRVYQPLKGGNGMSAANEKISECESAALAFVLDGLPSSGEAPPPVRAAARLPIIAPVGRLPT